MEITINSLARGQQLTSQDLSDESFTLIIDRANYFQFAVDDIEKKMSHVNWESLASNRAAYRLADTYDQDLLGYMSGFEFDRTAGTWSARTTAVGTKSETTADSDELFAVHKLSRATFVSGGSTSDSLAVGTSGTYDVTPLALLSRMSTLLDLQNVDREGRWLVVDPVFEELLRDENSKFMDRDYQVTSGDKPEGMSNGKITSGKVRGFELYSSNNLPYIGTGPGTADNNGSSANYGVIVAGHRSAVSSAEQISKTESFRSQDAFADVVRGMHLYGRKILRPTGLLRAIYNRAA